MSPVTDIEEHESEPVEQLIARFFRTLREKPSGRVLEIGCRNRTGVLKRARVPSEWDYTGVDVEPGEGVDMVVDAHSLSKCFPPARFDAVFAMAVFEHLLMPWKAAVEIGKVLSNGGILLVASHQSFPIHEYPWDYFRFSDRAYHSLFNRYTGFELLDAVMACPARIVHEHRVPRLEGLDKMSAYLRSAALARKIGEPSVDWNVDVREVLNEPYPE
jgi:hypothetical protein